MKPVVFLRDDDVYQMDPVFLELFNAFVQHKVPVVYGIIPALLEQRLTDFLCTQKSQQGVVDFDIVQHGFSHQDYSRPEMGETSAYEFGPGRTYAVQLADIKRGKEIMEAAFGPWVFSAFVPPFHGFDAETLRIVERLEFTVFSAGYRVPFSKDGVADYPAEVSLNDYSIDGEPQALDERSMLHRFYAGLKVRQVVGMVYHHRVINSSAKMSAMKVFIRLLAKLRDRGEICLVTFSDMLRMRGEPSCFSCKKV